MSADAKSKEQLLQEFAAAYERLIAVALVAEGEPERVAQSKPGGWGPHEVLAHLTGWEVMASVRIPRILAGTPPAEFTDPEQERMMNDAINSAFVTLGSTQPLDELCAALRQAYQRTVEILASADQRYFQPGKYVYERTNSVIEHCQEHIAAHLSPTSPA